LEQKTKKRAQAGKVDEPEQDYSGQIQFLGFNQCAKEMNNPNKRFRVKRAVVRVYVYVSKKPPDPKTKARDKSNQNWNPLL
jgi:hypothetical protein